MKKATLSVGLFLCALVFLGGGKAYALSPGELTLDDPLNSSALEYDTTTVDELRETKTEKKPTEKPPSKPVPIQHVVVEGETLTIIAEKHASTWMRLFNKNTQVADPNIITVGETVTIPLATEQLAERPLPVIQPPVPVTQEASQNNGDYVPAYQPQGDSAGNTYYAGYCTWYAKNRRPDLPNNLGNADQWVYRAQAQGIATGSTPSPGAIGQQGMHVVYVESVNGDGTVTISEMNYEGLYITSTRTVPAGSFTYIY